MSMTDAYELARRKNLYLQPMVEDYVSRAPEKEKEDFPALVHRAVVWAKSAGEAPPARPAPAASRDPIRTVESFSRSLRRSAAQLQELEADPPEERETLRKKLDTCLTRLEELQRTVSDLKNKLEA